MPASRYLKQIQAPGSVDRPPIRVTRPWLRPIPMPPARDLSLDLPGSARSGRGSRDRLAHERPMLGSMQQGRYTSAAWLLAGVDVAAAALALAAILLLAGGPALPALAIAPLLFAGGIAACGGYRRSFDELGGIVPRWVFRILAAGLFAWSAALLSSVGGPALDAGQQLSVWALAILISAVGRTAASPLLRRLRRPERWIVVGEEVTAGELAAYAPLRQYASIVCEVMINGNGSEDPDRAFALRLAERHRADRGGIAPR